MNKDQQLAHHILDAVGGIDNVDNIIHCMTRVRLKINNETQVDYPKLKNIEGVLGVIQDERLQIVVGPGTVNEVSAEMVKLSGVQLGEDIPHRSNTSNIKNQAQQNKREFQ